LSFERHNGIGGSSELGVEGLCTILVNLATVGSGEVDRSVERIENTGGHLERLVAALLNKFQNANDDDESNSLRLRCVLDNSRLLNTSGANGRLSNNRLLERRVLIRS